MDLWFGDSWPIGSELGTTTDIFDNSIFPNVLLGRDNPLKAFPHFVSTHRNTPYINFSRGSSSIEYTLNQLLKFCKNVYNPKIKYTAFLCATAQNRGFGVSGELNKELHYCNKRNKTQYDLFIYDSIIALNSFYTICHMYKIECHIVPIFCNLILPENFSELILFNDTLLTDTSLVEETFKTKFIEDALQYIDDEKLTLDLDPCSHLDWITPNKIHPNIIGHRKLAYKLIELLENH